MATKAAKPKTSRFGVRTSANGTRSKSSEMIVNELKASPEGKKLDALARRMTRKTG